MDLAVVRAVPVAVEAGRAVAVVAALAAEVAAVGAAALAGTSPPSVTTSRFQSTFKIF